MVLVLTGGGRRVEVLPLMVPLSVLRVARRHLPVVERPHVVFVVGFEEGLLDGVNAILVTLSTKRVNHFLRAFILLNFVGVSIISGVSRRLSACVVLAVFGSELGVL